MVSDPRCIAGINAEIHTWAWNHYQGMFSGMQGGGKAAQSGMAATQRYTQRVITAIKQGKTIPAPTVQQYNEGMGDVEADHIVAVIQKHVQQHILRLQTELTQAAQVHALFPTQATS
jgi:hypothetical protein